MHIHVRAFRGRVVTRNNKTDEFVITIKHDTGRQQLSHYRVEKLKGFGVTSSPALKKSTPVVWYNYMLEAICSTLNPKPNGAFLLFSPGRRSHQTHGHYPRVGRFNLLVTLITTISIILLLAMATKTMSTTILPLACNYLRYYCRCCCYCRYYYHYRCYHYYVLLCSSARPLALDLKP